MKDGMFAPATGGNVSSGTILRRAALHAAHYDAVKASYGLDKPLVIGEFFAASSVDALQRHEDWYAKGYAGAWAWSFRADTAWGSPDTEILRSWAEIHQPAIDIPPAR